MERISDFCFIPGRVYIFKSTHNGTEGEAWGVFDKWVGEAIHLEVMSFDLKYFLPNRPLPSRYRFVREALHEEIRDFAFNFGAAGL